MQEAVASPFAAWENFYVIVGSSAGALTGLMFVVITLIADTGMSGDDHQTDNLSVAAFGTPTVVHFCTVLLIAGFLSAPWHDLIHPAILLGATGIAGVTYILIVILRARRQKAYKPVFEDWLFHVLLPGAAYATMFLTAFLLENHTTDALFALGAVSLVLLFDGIHNSWDTVTYMALRKVQEKRDHAQKR